MSRLVGAGLASRLPGAATGRLASPAADRGINETGRLAGAPADRLASPAADRGANAAKGR